MMQKKKFNWFFFILSSLFLIYLAFYIAYTSGYYEANVSRHTIITQEKLEEFENDVKNNKEIDVKDYIEKNNKDYSSKVSKIGTSISSSIDSFMDGGMSDFFNFLGRLFT